MLLNLARDRRVLFIGGKGGVGKTTVAAATAIGMASEGRRVLLVSTDPAHNLGHLFGRDIGPSRVRLAPNLDGVELDPEQTARQHLDEVGTALRRLMPAHLAVEVDKHMALSMDTPGMHEAAMLERIAQTVEEGLQEYDLLVFDTAPSGHTARLMALPEMMSAWVEGLMHRQERAGRFGDVLRRLGGDDGVGSRVVGDTGATGGRGDRDGQVRELLDRRRHRFVHLRAVLGDPAVTAFVIVLVAERLPVMETIELHAQLRRAGVTVGGLVVNKRSPEDAGEFMAARARQEQVYLQQLVEALPDLPIEEAGLQAAEVVGVEALAAFAGRLRDAAGAASRDAPTTTPRA